MNIKIDGNVLLKNMMFWAEKTDDDCIEMAEKNLVSVTNIKNNEDIGVFDDKHFMPMDVWREFQLRKILE